MKTFQLTNLFRGGKRVCASALLLLAVEHHAAAQNILTGLQSTINASGAEVAGSITSGPYVTAVFAGNAYIQDASGGVYFYKGGTGTGDFGLSASNIGGTISNLTGGGFDYYATGTQFEYEPESGVTYTGTATTGVGTNIPASFYTLQTTAQVNSAASQGSVSSPGIQDQLVTLDNVVITPTGSASATTFTSGGTYTLTDMTGTAVLYINAASGVVGTAVPVGPVDASGVLQDYKGTSEVLPVGTYDFTSPVPEPASHVLMGLGGLVLVMVVRRTRSAKIA